MAAGSEDLLAHQARVVAQTGPDRRLRSSEPPLSSSGISGTPPPITTVAPSRCGQLVIGQHLASVGLADQRTEVGRRILRPPPMLQGACTGSHARHELVEHRPFARYSRSVPRQTCPQLANTDRSVPSIALSISQSANTMPGFLPPSSKETSRTPVGRRTHDRLAGSPSRR